MMEILGQALGVILGIIFFGMAGRTPAPARTRTPRK